MVLFSFNIGNKKKFWGGTCRAQFLMSLLELNDALLGNGLDQMMLLYLDLLCYLSTVRDQRDT